MSAQQPPMQQTGVGLFPSQRGPNVAAAPTPSASSVVPQQASVVPQQASVVPQQASVVPQQASAQSSQDDTVMREAGAGRRQLSPTEQKKIIEAILNAPDKEANLIKQAWENEIPHDCDINYTGLLAHLHPDKFQIPEEKSNAERAFQSEKSPKKVEYLAKNVLELQWTVSELERLYPGERDRSNQFYQGASAAEQHLQGELLPYHKEAHEKATPYLQSLYVGLQQHPQVSIQNNRDCPARIQDDIQALAKINQELKTKNIAHQKDPELGFIQYDRFCGLWRPIIQASPDQTDLVTAQMHALKTLCEMFGYPSGWADIPTKPQGPPASQGPSASEGPPQSMQPNQENMQLHHASAGGRIRTISLMPRTVSRSIHPGYTSTGEKICMIQYLGLMGARFIVEDSNGKIRLVSSAASGGQLAIDQAAAVGIPSTLRDEQSVRELREQVRSISGGTHGLNWVAVGEINTMHNKSPYIVVGFYYEGPGGNPPLREVGLSRSSLKKILSPKAADRLITEAMTYDPDVTLQEAIAEMSGLSLGAGTGQNLLPPPAAAPSLTWPPTMAQQLRSNRHASTGTQMQQHGQSSSLGYSQQTHMQQPYVQQATQGPLFPYSNQHMQATGQFATSQQPQMQQTLHRPLFGSNQNSINQNAQGSLFPYNQQPQIHPTMQGSVFGLSQVPQMQNPYIPQNAQGHLYGYNQQPQMQQAYHQQLNAQPLVHRTEEAEEEL